jgi:tRNA nucleotidyltransferase/poly(A) polymerase
MFRFLDKRFYRRTRLDFDLRTLACEHIGMSRSYAPTELKRRLRPALEELEQLGFLEPLDPEERYSWVSRGCWRIILIRTQADEPGASAPETEASSLAEALVARGVTSKVAAELVANHPPVRLRTKLEVFDWLVKNEDKRVGKNPAGYLVASIRADYQAPGEFTDSAKAEEIKQKAEEADHKAKKKAREESEKAKARETELKARWDKLTEAERDAIRASVKADNPGLGRWKNMLEPLCLAALEARDASPQARQKGLFPIDED